MIQIERSPGYSKDYDESTTCCALSCIGGDNYTAGKIAHTPNIHQTFFYYCVAWTTAEYFA